MAQTTLDEIRKIVRRITRAPSENNLTTTELDNYINQFILYDFPQNIRLFNLRSTFTFYTQPNVDVYESSDDPNNALYEFKNRIVAVHPTVYVAGYPSFYTQQPDTFFANWGKYAQITAQVAIADGTTGPFTGTIQQAPFLQNNVTISTITTNNTAMTLVDYPINNETGILSREHIEDVFTNLGTINYLTGAFTVNFPNLTTAGASISAQVVPYQPSRPNAVLFYDQKFTLRPVPDNAYPVEMQVDILPTELLATDQNPQIKQWYEYIALGACTKVLRDRMDIDTLQDVMVLFKQAEMRVLSSTSTTLANERSATIYSRPYQWGYGWWGWGPFNGPF